MAPKLFGLVFLMYPLHNVHQQTFPCLAPTLVKFQQDSREVLVLAEDSAA